VDDEAAGDEELGLSLHPAARDRITNIIVKIRQGLLGPEAIIGLPFFCCGWLFVEFSTFKIDSASGDRNRNVKRMESNYHARHDIGVAASGPAFNVNRRSLSSAELRSISENREHMNYHLLSN
jgi:hypothetical protein